MNKKSFMILFFMVGILYLYSSAQQGKGKDSEIEKHLKLADIFIKEGYYDLAELELQKCLEFDSKNEKVIVKMGYVYFQKGEVDKALNWYEKSLDKISNPRDVLINIARIYMKKGELTKALEVVDKALKIAPESVVVYFTKAEILLKMGKKSEVKKLINLAEKYVHNDWEQGLLERLKKEIDSSMQKK
ncbi:tetratricopeptide repeat protein [bacterium]|nr:tetratricopeptide repeat protein [bacterium]